MCVLIHSLVPSSIHSFPRCLSLSTYYVLGPRPGPGHTFQDLLLRGGADRKKQWQHQGKGNRGSHWPSCPRPAPPDATQGRCLRQRYPRVPGEQGLADTGQEATQRPWERHMGHLGGEAGSAQRPRHLIQCLGACQAEGRRCQALVGKTPLAPGGLVGPAGGCRAGPGM